MGKKTKLENPVVFARVTPDVARRVAEHAERMKLTDAFAKRSDALRHLIEVGLAIEERRDEARNEGANP